VFVKPFILHDMITAYYMLQNMRAAKAVILYCKQSIYCERELTVTATCHES